MRGGSKCASTTAGGQCVITTGVTQKLQWSVSSWGIQLLDVSYVPLLYVCIRAHGWISHYKAALHSTCLAWFMYGREPCYVLLYTPIAATLLYISS